MLGQKHSLDSEIQMFKPAKIVNFSSSLVQACFRLKIFLREKGSITYFLLCNKLTQNLVTSNNHHYLSIVYGSVAWVRFRDLAFHGSPLHLFMVQQSAGSQQPHLDIWFSAGYWLGPCDPYFLSSSRLGHSQGGGHRISKTKKGEQVPHVQML